VAALGISGAGVGIAYRTRIRLGVAVVRRDSGEEIVQPLISDRGALVAVAMLFGVLSIVGILYQVLGVRY
jgi:hypothetical protein